MLLIISITVVVVAAAVASRNSQWSGILNKCDLVVQHFYFTFSPHARKQQQRSISDDGGAAGDGGCSLRELHMPLKFMASNLINRAAATATAKKAISFIYV